MSIITRIKAAVGRIVASPRVQSVARHAFTAAVGVVVAAAASGGVTGATAGIAAAAAARVVLQAIQAATAPQQ